MTNPDPPDLCAGRVHEALMEDCIAASARLFAAAMAARRQGPTLWVLGPGAPALCPHGLYGAFDPGWLIFARAPCALDALWCLEQALRSGAILAAILETNRPIDLRQSRRLQLAAESSGAMGLCLAPSGGANAMETRWRCAPLPSLRADETRFVWECIRNRRGALGRWEGARDETTGHLHMAAASGGGAYAQRIGDGGESAAALCGDSRGARRLAALLAQSGGGGGGADARHGAL